MPTPPAAADPRHGTTAGRSAGCNCFPCRLAHSQWRNNRTRGLRRGTWQPWVDATPVREHLRVLAGHSIGTDQVIALTGLPAATISRIIYAIGGRQRCRQVRRQTADRILAVQPILANVADPVRVPGHGTVRRLRALVAIGWPMDKLGAHLPIHPEAARRLIRNGGRCTAKVARATVALYDQLSMTPPAPWTWVHDRARKMATESGWAPPVAWDDETIDVADATPDWGAQDDPLPDMVAVGQALAGALNWGELNDAERAIAVRRLRDGGATHNRICVVLNVSDSRLRSWTARNANLLADVAVAA